MAQPRTPSPKRTRSASGRAAPAAAPAASSTEASGLGDVPPPLVFERTAAAAEDDGFDAATAAVFAAVAAVDVFCVTETGERVRHRLGSLVHAADLAQHALEDVGAGEEEFTHLFAPRLPFDVLLGDTGRLTAGDLFLERWGDELPKDAVRAVKALLVARDTLARATFQGKASTVDDLVTGRVLPGPSLLRRTTRPFFCRLVRLGGVHVPLAVKRAAGRHAVGTLLAELAAVTAVGNAAFGEAGLRLRSPGKSFGLGSQILGV
ncbi:MAG: hypothetical protein ACYDBY_15905 [Thermoanaerobaculia bacterium]